ncbi:MAG: triphosphoribosyl-dephospho-CoA synthase MdcB [Steroidobacteraceae bacterium]
MIALRASTDAQAPSAFIARTAVRALFKELVLYPKPGLVSRVDSGAHADMNAATLMRSLFTLRHYFRDCASAGASGAAFPALQRIGLAAERRMMRATGEVNTHRGAIFCLGLLAAAAGSLIQERRSCAGQALGQCVAHRWGDAIACTAPLSRLREAAPAAHRPSIIGARRQAVGGYPCVFSLALPVLTGTLARSGSEEAALVQTLFTLMATLDDTNLLRRGGKIGLAFVQSEARRFLAVGGVFASEWRARAIALHHDFIARRLSPGGSADLLAGVWFAAALQGHVS